MPTLENNDEINIGPGLFTWHATGALEMQWFKDGGFKTLKDGVIAGEDDDLIQLSATRLKIINAGANKLILDNAER